MAFWDKTPTEISIKQGGPAHGCLTVILFIFGAGMIAAAVAFFLGTIEAEFIKDDTPAITFFALFGLIWWSGSVSSRRNAQDSVVVIDSMRRHVRYRASSEDADIIIPFADLSAAIIHETVKTETRTGSIRSESDSSTQVTKTYSYRIYLQKKDGSIFWLYTFNQKNTALEHLRLILERIEISCIDEAGGDLARNFNNPYASPSARSSPGKVSDSVVVKEGEEGAIGINLRHQLYGIRGTVSALFLLALFIGCPVWFYFANKPLIPGWFLAIPGVFLFFALFTVFIGGRRYSLECSKESVAVSIRFWFPLFQLMFGKRISIPAPVLKAVRVNRYDGGNFHLEISIDKGYKLPRFTGASFNTGSVRMLPRPVVSDDLRPVGLWSAYPIAKRSKGPRINDLYVIEEMIQNFYGLDVTLA